MPYLQRENRNVSSAKPRVSIVTPSFNQAHFLSTTIDSVLNQSYPKVEYIVIDGGSQDGSLDILKRFSGDLIWRSEPDAGQAAAINKGWEMAQGEVLGWLNADDTLEPTAVSQAVGYLLSNPNVDIVYGECNYIDEGGKFIRPYPTQSFNYVEFVKSTIDIIPQPATFIRRRVLEKIGLLDQSLHYTMDFDYWLRAGLDHQIDYLPELLANLRIYPGAKSIRQLSHFAAELVAIYQKLYQNPSLPPSLLAIKQQAFRNIYYRAADCAFWGEDYAKARSFAVQAYFKNPLRPNRFLPFTLMGKFGKKLLRPWKANPYNLW